MRRQKGISVYSLESCLVVDLDMIQVALKYFYFFFVDNLAVGLDTAIMTVELE